MSFDRVSYDGGDRLKDGNVGENVKTEGKRCSDTCIQSGRLEIKIPRLFLNLLPRPFYLCKKFSHLCKKFNEIMFEKFWKIHTSEN
ncbi:hypothetical protein ANTQUA_LOCUS8502 [Anthophora quadrimaculata]